MASQYLEMFLATNPGSKVRYHFYRGLVLDRLSLQTRLMCNMFAKFPEVLLVIRSHDAHRKALYTFLADGPCVPDAVNAEKIVHVAVPKDESREGLTNMFRALKDFNSNWRDVRVFLVDPQFKEAEAVLEVFPSAEVALSAYHVCRHFQQTIYLLALPSQTEHLLIESLKTTMCSATRGNLRNMHNILIQLVKPSMLTQLNADWLLEDRIWALHRWRSSTQCFEYFQAIETLSRALTEIFKSTRDPNSIPKALLKYILEHAVQADMLEKRTCGKRELDIIDGRDGDQAEEPNKEPEDSALICQSLEDVCDPGALSLCRDELEIAQKSVRLMGANEETINVQLLENPNEVSYGAESACTCTFNQTLKLPCRHVLAVITASERLVQPEMIPPAWRAEAEDSEPLPVSPDVLQIIKGERPAVPEKEQSVESITDQLSRLLTDCSQDVFQQRYNTLRELADAWIGPYEQVKL